MTRRYCRCGQTRHTDFAFDLHLTPTRPGCGEIAPAEYAALHGNPDHHDQRRTAS